MSVVHTFTIKNAYDMYFFNFNLMEEEEGLETYQVGDNFVAFESEDTLTNEDQKRILKHILRDKDTLHGRPAQTEVIVKVEWNRKRGSLGAI